MAILTAASIAGLFSLGQKVFAQKEPTPEEQKEKGRTWYAMLQDFIVNSRSSTDLANIWSDQLPFKQKNTRKRFMTSHIVGKSSDSIVNTLVAKINDELVKAVPPFPRITKDAILSGMGVSGGTAESPAGMSSVDANVALDGLDATQSSASLFDPKGSDFDVMEGRVYFFALMVIVLIVGVFTWLFWKPKKRR